MIPKIFQFLRLFDAYPLIRPVFFHIDPETAHNLSIKALKRGLGPKLKAKNKIKGRAEDEDDPVLGIKVCGLDFPNPLGLAAGFDKQAEVMREILDFGFGFTEVGTITPLPQPGNPRPRLFRIPEAEAAINRFGFNSDGMDICARHIAAWRDAGADKRRGIVGINIGKNKDSTDAAADYVKGIRMFASQADYLTVNVSSPNTPGLRNLQGREDLADLLRRVLEVRDAGTYKPPVFVKIAPDQTGQQEEDIAEVVLASGVDGVIIGNTSVTRPTSLPAGVAKEQGGLSGKPIFEMSTQLLGRMYKRTQGKIPLIGAGGVSSGADAYVKIRAGASLVQIYTALIYKGPGLVPRIKRELAALLRRDGFASIGAAVGADVKF